MKMIQSILAAAFLLGTINGNAQSISQASRISALRNVSSANLTWYTTSLRPSVISPASNGTVLNTRSANGNRIDIGVGLPDAATPFATNGATRQTTSGDATCTIQPMKVDFLTSGNFNLFSSENNIYPGQFFSINSVILNSFASFNSPQRKPFQLGINIFNARNTSNMLNVTDLTRSPLPEIQNTLLAPNYGAAIPAEGILNMIKINSSLELKASMETSRGVFLPLEELGIPVDISASIDASASASNTTRLNFYMLNFYQPMYTLNLLTNNDQLFQQQGAHSSCAAGAYVESVTYGRRVFVIIGSTLSETRVRAALSAAMGATVTGGDAAGVRLGATQSAETALTLRATAGKFFAKIYGGDAASANTAFNDIVNFKNSFGSFISSPSAGTFGIRTGALPLHYTLRRISDGSVLSVRSVGNYDDLISCNTATYKVEVLWKGIKVDNVVEGFGDTKEDIWGNLKLATATVNGSNRSIGATIKNISKDNAISIAAGSTDNDDVAVKVLEDLKSSEINSTILNFSEDVFDWEPFHNPAYTPISSAELKFNLADKAAQINALQPGASVTFDNIISLKEEGPVGTSRIKLLTKIKVTKI